ncbi:MAG: CRISPR-associated endonuclease Cas2 [Chloroflexi bacterium]|jgi:CRISPR-associated protein Cas2|nr:CRISPR-associated endonuclease Cas2 [Chloroflexota bacterium]
MEVLVTYDVATETAAGRRRLRKVAEICQAYGQRVQKSVFECLVTPAQYERLKYRLRAVIEPNEDSLRFYRLAEPRERYLETMGRQLVYDLHHPLVL